MFMTPLSASQVETYNASGGTQAENTDPQAAQDRFLKLFIAQLNNQDPMNPLDNAQMTTQMAQINTVTGIQQVNQTLKSLAEQMSMGQAIGASTLVGRQVVAAGNAVARLDGAVQGSFNLGTAADAVRVDFLDKAGQTIGSVDLGARSAGLHNFDWATGSVDPSKVASFQLSATSGGQAVAAQTLARQRVDSVGMVDGAVRLRTEGGLTLRYDQVLAFL